MGWVPSAVTSLQSVGFPIVNIMTGDGNAPNMSKVGGICRICGEQGMLDTRYILSGKKCKELNRLDLTSNRDYVARLCEDCHGRLINEQDRKVQEKQDKRFDALEQETKNLMAQMKHQERKSRKRLEKEDEEK